MQVSFLWQLIFFHLSVEKSWVLSVFCDAGHLKLVLFFFPSPLQQSLFRTVVFVCTGNLQVVSYTQRNSSSVAYWRYGFCTFAINKMEVIAGTATFHRRLPALVCRRTSIAHSCLLLLILYGFSGGLYSVIQMYVEVQHLLERDRHMKQSVLYSRMCVTDDSRICFDNWGNFLVITDG